MRTMRLGLMLLLGAPLTGYAGQSPDATLQTEFHVKYVAAGAVYLDRGKNAGLEEGMKLQIKRQLAANASAAKSAAPSPPQSETPAPAKPAAPTSAQSQNPEPSQSEAPATAKPAPAGPVEVAELRVVSVALVSAVCEVLSSTDEIKVGDMVFLEEAEIKKATEQKELGNTRKFPQVITFSEGDPLDDEARAFVPRPPSPEVNRARGMIGFDYGGLQTSGPFSTNTTQLGLFMKADISRIGGTYWGLSGYWRGRLNTLSGAGGPQTLNDLINRTYHLQMTYNNPNSHWVAGFGRLYLPWASSLDTLDGGYVGRRVAPHTTLGIFGGSTPDPTSWDYAPDRRTAGSFINFEGGSFENWRYTSTFGVALSTLGWAANRRYVFTENGLFYKNFFSIYHSLQADRPRNSATTSTGQNFTGVSRSFLTVRIQPLRRLELDFNHNYFRNIPTFDTNLISTGLVDNLLFQGFSVGAHIDLTKKLSVYNSLGRNSQSGDAHSSINQMYGVSLASIWKTGIRGDVRWSEFNSSFGHGTYSALYLSRQFGETFRCEFLAGDQHFTSQYSSDTSYRSLGGNVYWYSKSPLYLDGGFTRQQGLVQNYNQWYVGIGYRVDSRARHRARSEGK